MIDLSPDGLARNTARAVLREKTQLLKDAIEATHDLLGDQWDKQRFGSAVIKLYPFAGDDKSVSQVVLYRGKDEAKYGSLVGRDWQGNQVECDAGAVQVVRPIHGQPTDGRDDLYYLNEEGFAYERLRYEPATDEVYFMTSSGDERELKLVRPPFTYNVIHPANVIDRVRGVLGSIATEGASVEFVG